MNDIDTQESATKSITIKVLAILGFFATILLLIWITIQVLTHAPNGFASLASMADGLQRYASITEMSIATEKSTVNSNESFQISWTDVKQEGVYEFTHTCIPGIELLVRSTEGTLKPILCTETLTLPSDVHGLFLSLSSKDARFTDVPLKITFKNVAGEVAFTTEATVTVVNATIPTRGDVVAVVPEPETPVTVPAVTPATPSTGVAAKPVPPAPQVITTVVYPTSNPNGFVDLRVITTGTGVMENGRFIKTAEFDEDLQNVVTFNVKNIGTKTSREWTFKTQLPDGQVYESKTQQPLKPQEHVEFTLRFGLDEDSDSTVKITTTLSVDNDTNTKNNRTVSETRVND